MPAEHDIVVEVAAISSEIFFARMEGEDTISAPFSYSLVISSKDKDINPLDVLGTAALITVEGTTPRHFHGLVADFTVEEIRDDATFYRLTLRPWLWFLSLDTDNRIFQEKSVPDIIDEVFGAYPDAKFKTNLRGRYEPREYCVQYGESDLNFVQRLLEDEGIFYHFEHDAGGHTLVLVDSNEALEPGPDSATIRYEALRRVNFRDGDFITHWQPRAQVRSGKFAQTDYDFEKPAVDLMSVASAPVGHGQDAAEVYHYPGRYVETGPGDRIAQRRLHELQADQLRVEAKATAPHLAAGRKFSLELFPREAENITYLVITARYLMWDEDMRTGRSRSGSGYEVSLELSPEAVTYRPPRRTPRPRMQGPQTAVVVGPPGAEIFCDKYSRVKVHFHWDRLDGKNENSSCFVRVSAAWAGAGWGFIQIPRIGHEVIVDFLEGDPDQPIITGRVYNAQNNVPYGLPDNASQSGWKSWSTPSSGGFNELRFEDKAGSEEVYFQAEKDHVELVKNDETRTIGHDWVEDVGNDATQSIGHDRTESVANNKDVSVGNNRTVNIGVNDDETVGANRSLTVGSNETIAVGGNSSETIGMNHSQTVAIAQAITVGGARTDTVGAAEVVTVGAEQVITVGDTRAVTVGSDQIHTIGGDDGWTIGGSQTISIGKDQTGDIGGIQSWKIAKDQSTEISGAQGTTVGKDSAWDVKGNYGVKSGKSITIEAADSIIIKTGSAAISMKKDGTINIEGKDITLKGSGKINVKASSNVTVKGSKILNN
ncbi:MAG: type VI secretion system tip protein TssI/VgrG [Paracoccaceae bacterium]